MLVVRSASSRSVQYFFDGRDPGCWSRGADRLLGLRGPVDPEDLRMVLAGRDPRTSQFLPPRATARRRDGWDLIWSAPKSFSLLAATGPAEGNVALDAHGSAVTSVCNHIERELTASRISAPGGRSRCDGLISAAFTHRFNAAGEPHLHTHLLVANLSMSGGRWSAVRPDSWFIDRRSLSALYHLELRHQTAERGWDVAWRLRSDGLADLADVSRDAVRHASTQSRAVATLGPFEARRRAVATGRGAGNKAERAQATAATRGASQTQSAIPGAGPFAGTDRHGRTGGTSAVGNLDDDRLVKAVETRLATKRSDFRRGDVVVCLAECHPGGASVEEALAWTTRFCDASNPVPSRTSRPRWATSLSVDADKRLVRAIDTGWEIHPGAGLAHPVVRLVCPPGQSRLIDHAELIDGYHQNVEADGRRLVVNTTSPLAAQRWEILTSVSPSKPGTDFDVLVVDQADRRSTAELLVLTGEARNRRAQLVLVEGGTLPRLSSPASRGLDESAAIRLDLPPGAPWGSAAAETTDLTRAKARDGLRTGRESADEILAHWKRLSDLGVDSVMVGLGLEETDSLNRAARTLVSAANGREMQSPGVGRSTPPFEYHENLRVVMLSGRVREVPYGTRGTVVSGPGGDERAWVLWDGFDTALQLGAAERSRLGCGYAVTPGVASRTTGKLVMLGPRDAVPGLRDRVLEWVRPRGDIALSHEVNRGMIRGSRGGIGLDRNARVLGR